MHKHNTIIIDDKNTHFFNLLQNAMENSVESPIDTELCLITQQPLDHTKIRLACNHSFNYDAIYKEVYNQKYKIPRTEIQRVRSTEIKCPYCRKIQRGILPYVDGYEKKLHVNIPHTWAMKNNNCTYVFKSGKRKGGQCMKKCSKTYCGKCLYYEKQRAMKQALKSKPNVAANIDNQTSLCCDAIIKTGKRNGLTCIHPAKYNGKCGKHKK